MRFEITPEEAQGFAQAVIKYLRKRGMSVKVEKAIWEEASYRTTIVGSKRSLHVLVEAQGVLSYGRSLREFTSWLAARRHYAQFFIATGNETVLQVGVLADLKRDGVGILIVDEEGKVSEHQKARNPALVVTPDPTLRYGDCSAAVRASIQKFNETDRKDGLRDMCELVESLLEKLGVVACRRGWLQIPEDQFSRKDFSEQINELARREAYNPPHTPIVDANLKNDLHSFRTARNLVDHPTRGRREDARRERQFADRMAMGPRLVAELISLRRTIR